MAGRGEGLGSDYVIPKGNQLVKKRGGLAMITLDYGRGEGGKKCPNIDYVICERPLSQKKLRSFVTSYFDQPTL